MDSGFAFPATSASGAAANWATGTRKGLDRTNVKPSLRRIFTRPGWPPCPPLTIGSISGRMTWLQFISDCEVCKKRADVFLLEFAVAGSFQVETASNNRTGA